MLPGRVILSAPDLLTADVEGMRIAGRLVVDADGALVLRPSTGTIGAIDLLRPGDGIPLRIRSLAVRGESLVLMATLDLGLLAR